MTWYAGWLTVLFIAFGVFSYVTLKFHLEKDMREALARRARQVADTTQRSSENWQALGVSIHDHFAPEANSRLTRVSVDGSVVYVSGAPLDQSFDPGIVPLPSLPQVDETFERRILPDQTVLFVVTLSRQANDKQFVVEEGFSARAIDTALRERLIALCVGLTFLVFAAVAGGFLLVQRALTPVDRIIRSAEHISSHNLGERLPVTPSGDELERLSVALNHMIRRLDDAFQQTRRFLADASHELRTPLTVLHGELEAVAEKSGDNPGARGTAGSALEEVQRLKKIVDGLFALSRLDAGEAQEESVPVDLGGLAENTADQMCLLAEDKNIEVICHCQKGIFVKGDRSRLRQVLVNLLDNAIKYTPDGGKVEIMVNARNGCAALEVLDNGIGIPDSALPHVFERFFRTDKARSREVGGAGLGLSIVKSICVAHNGRVEVESKEGKGSRFVIELPLVKETIQQ